MTSLVLITTVPIITGILGYLITKLRNEFAFLGNVINLYYGLLLFIAIRRSVVLEKNILTLGQLNIGFYLDALAAVMIMAIGVIMFLLLIYSFRITRNMKNSNTYFLILSVSLSLINILILANNLLFFVFISFLLSLCSYVLLMAVTEKPRGYVHQSMLSLMIYDIFLIAAVVLLLYRGFNLSIISEPRIIFGLPCVYLGINLFLVGVIGKLGLIPLQSWSDKLAQNATVTINTLIVLLIQKTISIYLLIRLFYFLFDIKQAPYVQFIIIFIAAFNIIIASIRALKSYGIYQFLNQHSMVQSGFVLLGVSGLNPIALAGGLFHLLNFLVFQTALFFTSGSFEYWTKSVVLENFNGLGTKMPITFVLLLLAVLASIGIPPLNGFFSKLILLKGIFVIKPGINQVVSIIALLAFFFGLIMTVIYFAKFIRNFKGKRIAYSEKIREPSFTMWLPSIILSLICLVLGIFVYSITWRTIIVPIVQNTKLFSNQMLSLFAQTHPLHLNYLYVLIIVSLIIGVILSYTKPFAKYIRSI